MAFAPFAKKDKSESQEAKPRREPLVRRTINAWWERLFALLFGRSALADQASMYSAGRTGHDYLWNTLGQTLWGAMLPALTVIATQLAGAEDAGRFNLAFTIATLLLFLGNYGVRTYQVSDISEQESFDAYQIHRVMTCGLMLAAGAAYCALRSYDADMTLIAAGAFGYRAVDAFADVYEGRLQQMDKLYLSGISVALRVVIPLSVFTALLLFTDSLPFASIGLAAAELVVMLLVSLPLALLETPMSRPWEMLEVRELFRECFPAFAAMFLFNLIETMPKFAMEGVLPYEDQVYFSAIYFPAQMALMIVGFVYKPQLVRLASLWQDGTKRGAFDLVVVAMMAACVVVSLGLLLFMDTVGIPLSGILYNTDFERFRTAQNLMLVAGGLAAAIDFLFQILTVLREQAAAMRLYVLAFVVVTAASIILVRTTGFMGAVYAYLAVMVVLFVLLVLQYVMVRIKSRA